jgi:selenocysteine lyase/cysteine desulfurase
VLALTQVSNLTGVRLPARELVEAAHARGIYVHLDGAQSWGALDLDLKEIGCDSYSASAHKWFMGPKEAGILYVKEENIARIWPNIVAPGWGNDVDPDVKGARKFESLGQRDDACLAAVGTAVDFHRSIGHARVESRMVELATALKNGLAGKGFSLVTPLDPEIAGGVCILQVPSKKSREVVDRLYREHGIAAAPTGGLRLCPHVYNTMEHVERAVRAVDALRAEIG